MQDLYENLTVIILLYKENFELIKKCLNNIKNFKVIFVDNDNNLNLKKKIEGEFKVHKYILNKENLGWSKGVNQAIKACETKFILNLSADCQIDEKNIIELYEAINKYENTFIVTPTMFNENKKLTHSGGALIEKNLGYKVLNLEGDACVDFPLTTAILFRKKEMLHVGLFDEDLFLYYPDFEIGRRVKSHKKSIIQIYASKAEHTMGKLKINNPVKRVFCRNYYYTLDGLIYYYKANLHFKPIDDLRKEIPKLIFKSLINIFRLKFADIIVCYAKTLAYFNFKKRYLKK
tara:strand:+ start:397 stop:1266 length:870 start_codon:yes stop_codon:yes gene_type:complete